MNNFKLAICLSCLLPTVTFARSMTVKVSAGKYNRDRSIVAFKIPPELQGKPWRFVRANDGRLIPHRTPYKRPDQLVFILQSPLAAGKTRLYRLETPPRGWKPPKSDGVTITPGKNGAIGLKIGKRPILFYNPLINKSPIKGKPYYERSAYIHPIHNPAGQAVTDDFAPDHPHQHGLMYPYVRTRFKGRSFNFWEQTPGVGGLIVGNGVKAHTVGAVFGSIHAQLRFVDRRAKDMKPILDEEWNIRAYAFKKEFIFDLESIQRCSTENPLKILKHHYGGLAIRGHRSWKKDLGGFLTSQGKARRNGNHSRPNWVDIHGKVAGKETGITIFCHPGNFRAPQPVRLHPSMPYFCFAPMVLGGWTIKPGEPYRTHYRFYVHLGKLNVNRAQAIWHDYAHPVKVTLIKS